MNTRDLKKMPESVMPGHFFLLEPGQSNGDLGSLPSIADCSYLLMSFANCLDKMLGLIWTQTFETLMVLLKVWLE